MADLQDKRAYNRLFPVPPPLPGSVPPRVDEEEEQIEPEPEAESGGGFGEEAVTEIVKPPAPEEQDDMKDLFEGPKPTDRDMEFSDLVSAEDEDEDEDDFSDVTSLNDDDMDDLFGVDRSDVLGRAPRKKTNRVHRSPRPPTSMSGMT